MKRLPAHLEGVRHWLDRVAECVVVDSHSTDGTVDYLREHLRHPRVRFLDHPPGLYASWNHGVAHIRQPYTYISTIGDGLMPDGLAYLVGAASGLKAEVVMSPPRFCDEQGGPLADMLWPIHEIVAHLQLSEPSLLPSSQAFCLAVFFALQHFLQGLLGSSASNLYQTETLRRRPFPTGAGPVGDVIWGLQNALDVRIAIAPRPCSEFIWHGKEEVALSDEKVEGLMAEIRRDAECRVREDQASGVPVLSPGQADWVLAFIRYRAGGQESRLRRIQGELDQLRETPFWILNHRAWRLRSRRNLARQQCRTFDPWLIPQA
jgi:hypothetical protein